MFLPASCGGSDTTEPDPRRGTPTSLSVTRGSGQSGPAGAALPAPIVVVVKDTTGQPVSGAHVAWSTLDGTLSAATTSTDAQGEATVSWTLDARIGAQSGSARIGSLTADFGATATMPAGAAVLKTGGDEQTAVVATVLPDSLVVQARTGGTPLAGAPVQWLVEAGGGTVTGAGVTDAQGVARAAWTLGTSAGEQSMRVEAAGATSTTFSATAQPDRPAIVATASDSAVLGTWGDTARAVVSVQDRYGNAIPSPTLEWSSSDTSVAKVDAEGRITSRHAGVATLTVIADTARATLAAVVRLQLNAACTLPTAPPRPPVGSLPAYSWADLPVGLPDGQQANRGAVMDVDGDGDRDLVQFTLRPRAGQAPADGEVRVWRNDGNGSLVDATSAVFAGQSVVSSNTIEAATFDANGDARPDLWLANSGLDEPPFPGAPSMLLVAQADGPYRDASAAVQPNDASFAHSLAAGDVDCDGDIDVFLGSISQSNPSDLYINSGSAAFVTQNQRLPAFITSFQEAYTASEFCDFDRDGDPDLVLGGWSSTAVPSWRDALLVNDGFGRFRRTDAIRLPEPALGNQNTVLDIRCIDYDLDGWPDLALTAVNRTYSQNQLQLWHNEGNGTFTDATSADLPETITAGPLSALQQADLNADGWPDLVVAGPPNARVFINRGGRFAELLLPQGTELWQLYALDVTGDGKLDIVSPINTGLRLLTAR